MYAQPSRERIAPALAAAAVSAALGWALFVGLAGAPLAQRVEEGLAVFRVAPPAPPPVKVVPKRTHTSRPSGRAAPPSIRSQATQVAAPKPIVVVPLPPPADRGRAQAVRGQ
ncbi:MAG: hypothetical protein PGN16_08065 [Sphingomonas phyllosphaerae]|uniref:hypothetical protein n=1 Tax=Sphingomonas phyllosphaerae TaxID=257003 RepID=UPI002FF75B5C